MDGIIYITLDQAKAIHRKTIQYSGGGTYEHFDLGRLESVLQNIQNDDYYPTFVDKITHLFFCTCEFHCFADGNKRLAITLCAQFLLFNGYMAIAKDFLQSWKISVIKWLQEKLTRTSFIESCRPSWMGRMRPMKN